MSEADKNNGQPTSEERSDPSSMESEDVSQGANTQKHAGVEQSGKDNNNARPDKGKRNGEQPDSSTKEQQHKKKKVESEEQQQQPDQQEHARVEQSGNDNNNATPGKGKRNGEQPDSSTKEQQHKKKKVESEEQQQQPDQQEHARVEQSGNDNNNATPGKGKRNGEQPDSSTEERRKKKKVESEGQQQQPDQQQPHTDQQHPRTNEGEDETMSDISELEEDDGSEKNMPEVFDDGDSDSGESANSSEDSVEDRTSSHNKSNRGDFDPKFHKFEQQRQNYDLMTTGEENIVPLQAFFHKKYTDPSCKTMGFIKLNGKNLYVNEYAAGTNRSWRRFELHAQDKEYEISAEDDPEFQQNNSLQLPERWTSCQTYEYSTKKIYGPRDVIDLSAAAWLTDWTRIPWDKFPWSRIGLDSFSEASQIYHENELDPGQVAEILRFQLKHEIDQIDPELYEEYGSRTIYVRTLWDSEKYPHSWEPSNKTERLYGGAKNQPYLIHKKSKVNMERYIEGILDPTLIRYRESSVGMKANGEIFGGKSVREPSVTRRRERSVEFGNRTVHPASGYWGEDDRLNVLLEKVDSLAVTVQANASYTNGRLAELEQSRRGGRRGGRGRWG